MYYLGAMQWLILKIAWLMQISLKTSATESMVAAGIFCIISESEYCYRHIFKVSAFLINAYCFHLQIYN